MALQKSIELPSGLSLDEAYHRLVKVELDYVNKHFMLGASIYINKQARDDGKSPIKTMYFQNSQRETFEDWFNFELLDELNINPIERGYEYLKTLPEYQGSVDV